MNPPLSHPSASPAPAIQNRQQLDAVVENIVHLQLERAELESCREREIAAVRDKYQAPLLEIDRFLLLEQSWVEKWALDHPDELGADRSLACTHAVIGFRLLSPRVEKSRRATWAEAAQRLAQLAWGARYLRTPAPEVDKEAIIADRAHLDAGDLRMAGLHILENERFFLTPHDAPEGNWEEAA
jgi:phage host-nuclease inhibitor protein Gam